MKEVLKKDYAGYLLSCFEHGMEQESSLPPPPTKSPYRTYDKNFSLCSFIKMYPYPSHEVVIRNCKEEEGSEGHFGTKI